ncbi:MAG: ABC-2 family transporter protein [Candidatus Microgenomates bacterium]
MRHNLKIFINFAKAYFKMVTQSRTGVIFFTLGKLLRFLFFLSIIFIIFKKTTSLNGWGLNQVLLCYFVFNFLDTATQMLYREVYRFRQLLVSGNLDLVLIRPYNPLLKVLLGGVDFLDLLLLIPYFLILNFLLLRQFSGGLNLFLFWLFIANSFIILTAFHILVLGLAIFTTDVDHTIFIYRDILRTGQFPIDIYKNPINFVLTFIIPVGIIVTFPIKIFYNLLDLQYALISIVIAFGFLFFSLIFWKKALRFYQSASS